MWGSYKTDKRGKVIEGFLDHNTNVVLLNDLSRTYFKVSTGQSSAIDLTLCSNNIATEVEWQVLDDLHGSDYFPLIIQISQTEAAPNLTTSRWKI